MIYLLFVLLGKFVECERETYSGRIDLRIQTAKYIYLFEDYALPFVVDARILYKIGVSFDSATRQLDGWKVGE